MHCCLSRLCPAVQPGSDLMTCQQRALRAPQRIHGRDNLLNHLKVPSDLQVPILSMRWWLFTANSKRHHPSRNFMPQSREEVLAPCKFRVVHRRLGQTNTSSHIIGHGSHHCLPTKARARRPCVHHLLPSLAPKSPSRVLGPINQGH